MSSAPNEGGVPLVRSIMVVEDEPIVAQDIRFMLEDAGYQCLGPYRTVEAALKGLSKIDPDFVILDVNLLDGQAFPVADALVERRTPFAFCSAHFPKEESEERYPGVAVVGKPFVTDELIGAVKAAL